MVSICLEPNQWLTLMFGLKTKQFKAVLNVSHEEIFHSDNQEQNPKPNVSSDELDLKTVWSKKSMN